MPDGDTGAHALQQPRPPIIGGVLFWWLFYLVVMCPVRFVLLWQQFASLDARKLATVSAEVAGASVALYAVLAVDSVLWAALVLVTWLFLTRRRILPKAMIAWQAAKAIAWWGMLAVSVPFLSAGQEIYDVDLLYAVVLETFWSTVWIAYFALSKRVKATFVL